jgi:hypothetical protein
MLLICSISCQVRGIPLDGTRMDLGGFNQKRVWCSLSITALTVSLKGSNFKQESQKNLEMAYKLLNHPLARSRRSFNEGPISIARGLRSNID